MGELFSPHKNRENWYTTHFSTFQSTQKADQTAIVNVPDEYIVTQYLDISSCNSSHIINHRCEWALSVCFGVFGVIGFRSILQNETIAIV